MILVKEEKITAYQATQMFTAFIFGSVIAMNPAADAGSDAWLAYLIGWLCGFLIFLMVAALASLHPGKSLVGILEDCVGKTAGKCIGLIYALFFIALTAAVTSSFGYYEITTEIPETPILFVEICFLLVAAFAVRIGLEVIGRVSEIFMLIITAIVLITLFSVATDFHTDAFEPVLIYGLRRPLTAGLRMAFLPFGESVAALTILPHLTCRRDVFRVSNGTSLFAGALLYITMLRNILVVGVPTSARILFPSEKIFRLMPGIDIYPLLDFDVIVSGIIKLSVLMYAILTILRDVFALEDHKLLCLPVTGILIPLTLMIQPNIFLMKLITQEIIPLVYFPFSILLPFLLLLISLFHGKAAKTAA